jgi:hypothetical protein
MIETNKKGEIVAKKGKLSCKLSKGVESFIKVIDRLNNLQPLSKLNFHPDLIINLESFNDEKSMNAAFEKRKRELKEKGLNADGYYDRINDTQFGLMMQVVDDNTFFKGKRSELLLRNDLNYLGISTKSWVEKKDEKTISMFIAYFLFA